MQEKCIRLQAEADSALQQLEEAEQKASAAAKQSGSVGTQLSEVQVSLE